MANQTLIEQIQERKAQIIAQEIFPLLDEDDTSSEILEMVQARTTDIEVEERVLELLERMDIVNEDPGNEEAEELLTAEEEEFYAKLADSESED